MEHSSKRGRRHTLPVNAYYWKLLQKQVERKFNRENLGKPLKEHLWEFHQELIKKYEIEKHGVKVELSTLEVKWGKDGQSEKIKKGPAGRPFLTALSIYLGHPDFDGFCRAAENRPPNWTENEVREFDGRLFHSLAPDEKEKIRGAIQLVNATLDPVEMLNDHNLRALQIYEDQMLSKPYAPKVESPWESVWVERVVLPLRWFVPVSIPVDQFSKDRSHAGTDVNVKILQMIRGLRRVKGDQRMHVFLTGPAGCGKSTMLNHSYLDLQKKKRAEPHLPNPILIHPQFLNKAKLAMLAEEETVGGVPGLLKLWGEGWLTNVSDQMVSKWLEQLQAGQMLLMIDAVDELIRIDLHGHILGSLFGSRSPVKYIIATTRPEVYDPLHANHALEEQVVAMPERWDMPTVGAYLLKRFSSANHFYQGLLQYVQEEPEQSTWLLNPRALSLVCDMYGTQSGAADVDRLMQKVRSGEAQVYESLFRIDADRFPAESRADFRQFLKKVGKYQVREYRYVIEGKDVKNELRWKIATGLLRYRGDSPCIEVSFHSLSLAEYFTAEYIANDICKSIILDVPYLGADSWSESLLEYASQSILKKLGAIEVRMHLLPRLLDFALASKVEWDWLQGTTSRAQTISQKEIALQRKHRSVNLLHLYGKLSVAVSGGAIPELANCHLERLYLQEVRLAGFRFNRCTIENCLLRFADLSGTVFEDCQIRGTDFANAVLTRARICSETATNIDFGSCTFDKALIEDMEPSILVEQLDRLGAEKVRSRYRGKFKELFDGPVGQARLFGKHYLASDLCYNERILAAIRSFGAAKPIYLIDLMAGGENRLGAIYAQAQSEGYDLHILAIDRDCSRIQGRNTIPVERLKIVNRTIYGQFHSGPGGSNTAPSLSEILHDCFPATRLAHVIIGKKAIHEIPRIQQSELFLELGATLHQDGRLVLFTDSPVSMTELGYQKLNSIKSRIKDLLPTTKNDEAKLRELDSYLQEQVEFSNSLDDQACFSNLWIYLKDLANDNYWEMENRYFSSLREVREWGMKAGLELANEDEIYEQGFCYHLNATNFNERGINAVGKVIQEQEDNITEVSRKKLVDKIQDTLEGKGLFGVFKKFSKRHLLPAEPGTLGEKMSAHVEDVDFLRLLPDIRKYTPRLSLAGHRFRFPTHVVDFVRRK